MQIESANRFQHFQFTRLFARHAVMIPSTFLAQGVKALTSLTPPLYFKPTDWYFLPWPPGTISMADDIYVICNACPLLFPC